MKLPDRARMFDAVFDEAAFAAVLDDIAIALGARSYLGGFAFDDGSRAVSISCGYFSVEQVAEYYEDFYEHDPWIPAILADWRPGQARGFSNIVSEREVESSKLYQGFVRVIGDDTFRCASVGTQNDRGRGAISFQRGRDTRDFTRQEMALLDTVAPDLARIMSLRGSIQGRENALAARTQALDAVRDGLIILEGNGRVSMANAEAERRLRRGDVLDVWQGRLRATARSAQKMLDVALASLAERHMAAVCLTGPGGDVLALTLLLLPENGARRRILVAFPAEQACKREQLLQQLYGLSAGEAAIAIQLADGLDPAEIAEARRTSINTVRVQLRAIGEKLGCSRLIDIVRRVASLPRIGDFPLT